LTKNCADCLELHVHLTS